MPSRSWHNFCRIHAKFGTHQRSRIQYCSHSDLLICWWRWLDRIYALWNKKMLRKTTDSNTDWDDWMTRRTTGLKRWMMPMPPSRAKALRALLLKTRGPNFVQAILKLIGIFRQGRISPACFSHKWTCLLIQMIERMWCGSPSPKLSLKGEGCRVWTFWPKMNADTNLYERVDLVKVLLWPQVNLS